MPQIEKSLAIIIVHYHTPVLLRECIEALLTDLKASDLRADIVVVDNGEDANDQDILNLQDIRILTAGKNIGYAAGLNLGIRNTKAEYLFCMNPDVIVLPGCLSTLLSALNDTMAAGPKFYWNAGKDVMLPPTEDRNLMSELSRRVSDRWARRRWRRHAQKHWNAQGPLITASLSGALLAIRRDAWERAGPFEERFQLYFEETDWLIRARKKNMNTVFVPAAEAVHYYNQSAAKEPKAGSWFAESTKLFGRRHYGPFVWNAMEMFLPANRPSQNGSDQMIRLSEPVEVPLPDTDKVLWIEISLSTRGFPAATAKVLPHHPRLWKLPLEIRERMTANRYFIRIVENPDSELASFYFNHE